MAKLYTWDPGKNKKVLCGEIQGTALFRWVEPQHFMRVVDGYGIQEIAFQEIVKRGVRLIILKETATEQRWEATTETWLQHSKVADYGHGKQRFLSMKYQSTHKIPGPDEQKEALRDKSKQQTLV
jgi:hypothetical protein